MKFLEILKEQDGQYSARRVSAFLLIFIFVLLSGYPIYKGDISVWYVFIPSILSIAAVMMLFFFTTWGDVKDCIAAAKGVK